LSGSIHQTSRADAVEGVISMMDYRFNRREALAPAARQAGGSARTRLAPRDQLVNTLPQSHGDTELFDSTALAGGAGQPHGRKRPRRRTAFNSGGSSARPFAADRAASAAVESMACRLLGSA